MNVAQDPVCEKARDGALASAFGWAERTVRRQIDTLRRLASVVLERMEAAFDGAEPDDAQGFCDGVIAIEKAVRRLGELHWIARLIDALRAKLADDLRRLKRGEAPARVFASAASDDTKPAAPPADVEPGRPAAERSGRGDAQDREASDRLPRGFGRDDFSKILKRPTDEIIAFICSKLGLSPDWRRQAEQAWEQAQADQTPPPAEPRSAPRPPDG